MPGFLRQSTAAQSRIVGPFVDDTDFKTAETALTIANTDVKLMSEGGASANKNSGGGTHRVNGMYSLTFDATDTATVGALDVSIVVAGALPVFDRFQVLEEAVYDALLAASAAGYQVPIWAAANSTVNLSNTTIKTATDVETRTADIQSRLPAALVSGRIDASVGAMAANVITATAIEADAITDAKVAADVTIASVTGAVGSVTGNVGGNVAGSVASVTAAVTVGTNNDKTGYALSATGSAALTEGYAALGAAATLPQLLYEVRALLAEKSISGTTLTTKKLDGATQAATYTLDDATTPSAITRAS